jgi:hypothetical protein
MLYLTSDLYDLFGFTFGQFLHGPHSPSGTAASPKCLFSVTHLEAASMPLWVQIPESLPTKVCPPTFVCFNKKKTASIPVRSPKLRHNPVSVVLV